MHLVPGKGKDVAAPTEERGGGEPRPELPGYMGDQLDDQHEGRADLVAFLEQHDVADAAAVAERRRIRVQPDERHVQAGHTRDACWHG